MILTQLGLSWNANIQRSFFKSSSPILKLTTTSFLNSPPLPLIHNSYLSYNSISSYKFLTSENNSSLNGKRHFSTTSTGLRNYKPQPGRFIHRSLFPRLFGRIPDSLKLIIGITAISSFFIFVALPFFIIVLPPIVFSGFLFFRGRNWKHKKDSKRRWDLLSNSNLIFKPSYSTNSKQSNPLFIPPPDQINNELATFELRRIHDAFWNNENSIADYFKEIKDINNLALGSLDGVQYTYNSSKTLSDSEGVMMVTQSRKLYDRDQNKEIANVNISLKNLDVPFFEDFNEPSANIGRSTVVIEIIPFGFNAFSNTSFIIDSSSGYTDDDVIIEVQGKTKDL